jgi:integrase
MSGNRAPHLQRRNGIYHLRVRVPDDVRLRLGRSEVRRSLGTYAHGKARSLAARYAARVMEAFVMIKQQDFTAERARSLVQNCFWDLVAETESYGGLVPETAEPDVERNEQHQMSAERIAALRHQITDCDFDAGIKMLAVQLTSPGVLSSLPQARVLDLLSGIARALIEQQRLFQLRIGDRLEPFEPADKLFQGCWTAPAVLQTPTFPIIGLKLGDALQNYLETQSKQWIKKTHMARQWQLRYLREHLGEETPLGSITPHDIRSFREAILKLRANHGKTRSQTFAEKQTTSVQHRIAQKTATLIFDSTKAFFRWCKANDGLIDVNPAADVTMPSVKSPKGQKSRLPFTADELHQLFSAPLFTGCKSINRRGQAGPNIIRDAKYWLPILGYYTGARLGELVQLKVRDVLLCGAIPYLSINEENDPTDSHKKHVKSDAGVRAVPLHPHLVALGFAEFVASRQKKKGTARLFPEFEYGSDGQASTVASKWFARFSDSAGLTDKKLVFHSFRHLAEDAFRDALQPQYVIDRILGHSNGSVSAGYGNGISLETAYSAVCEMKLRLDLPKLLIKQLAEVS